MIRQIERTCPKCRVRNWQYFSKPVPLAYGADTPAAVLATCSASGCFHEWRAIVKKEEA